MTSRGQFNSKSPTIRRILREASELSTSPSPDYTATPLDDNLFEWHFTLRGPPGADSNGPYREGMYHGRIVLPPTYPLRPPSFRFLNPSGRFETNREICLSISGHHEETWQPAWGLRTALVALRTFMETDAKGQLGGLECTDDMRRRMAKASQGWKCPSCGKSNRDILAACEEAAKSADSVKPDEEVPKELKMGWKDEMGKTPAEGIGESSAAAAPADDDVESAELAEGFVPTVPIAAESNQEPQRDTQTPYPPARPAQSAPQPTGTIPLPPPPQHPVPAQGTQQQRHSNGGVPDWVDRAIVGIAACLIVMILKILLGIAQG